MSFNDLVQQVQAAGSLNTSSNGVSNRQELRNRNENRFSFRVITPPISPVLVFDDQNESSERRTNTLPSFENIQQNNFASTCTNNMNNSDIIEQQENTRETYSCPRNDSVNYETHGNASNNLRVETNVETNRTSLLDSMNKSLSEEYKRLSNVREPFPNVVDDVLRPTTPEKEKQDVDKMIAFLMSSFLKEQVRLMYWSDYDDDAKAKCLLFEEKLTALKGNVSQLLILQLYVVVRMQAYHDFSASGFLFKAIENFSKHPVVAKYVKADYVSMLMKYFRRLKGVSIKQLSTLFTVFEANETKLIEIANQTEDDHNDELSLLAGVLIMAFESFCVDFIATEFSKFKSSDKKAKHNLNRGVRKQLHSNKLQTEPDERVIHRPKSRKVSATMVNVTTDDKFYTNEADRNAEDDDDIIIDKEVEMLLEQGITIVQSPEHNSSKRLLKRNTFENNENVTMKQRKLSPDNETESNEDETESNDENGEALFTA